MLLTKRELLGGAVTRSFVARDAVDPARGGARSFGAERHHQRNRADRRRTSAATRIARAQALMKANGIGAVLIEPGSSLIYFTGVRWGRSERLTAAVLPVEGDPCIVTPFFEEPSVRQTLGVPAEVRVWQEDEDPLTVVAGFLKDRKLAARRSASRRPCATSR